MQSLLDIESKLQEIILGKKEQIRFVLATLLAKGHVLLEDIPGTGKTTLAKAFAKLVGGDCHRVQFTPDLLPMDVLGGSIFNPQNNSFRIEKGPIFCNIFLADEINRASPRTQSSLLEAMAESQITLDSNTFHLPDFFMVIATQNNFEFEGVFPLPEAQLDRFMIQLEMGYISAEEETQLLLQRHGEDPLDGLQSVLTLKQLSFHQEQVTQIHIDESLVRYMVDIANTSRNHSQISLGLSPRALLLWKQFSQALAYLENRTFVNPTDIQKAFYPVANHRIFFHGEHNKKDILTSLLQSVAIPI